MTKFVITNPGLLDKTAMEAVEIPMLEILRDAKMKCPVDTGNLVNSIAVSGPYQRGRGSAVGEVGTNVEYAPYVEFGTTHGRAQPFLGPALEKARMRYGR